MGAVSRLENGRAPSGPWGFDSLSFRSFVPAWSKGHDARLLLVRCRFESCRRSSQAPVVETVMTPGPQPGSCEFESRRGCFIWLWGSLATPPVSGTGDRWFESSRPDLRGRGAAVLASLMSSRP
jgi:hypothetical protein